MESDGIVKREVFPEVPPRVEYSLTDLGDSLRPIINSMSDWGTDYIKALLELVQLDPADFAFVHYQHARTQFERLIDVMGDQHKSFVAQFFMDFLQESKRSIRPSSRLRSGWA